VAGIAIGTALACAAAHALQALLAGVSPYDAITFATAILLSVLLALSGSVIPSLRAAHVDPVRAIRE
jgi:ABC-type antimicrobial peptide transport system permease subunit